MLRFLRNSFSALIVIWATSLYAELRIMPLGDSITYDANYADNDNPRPTSRRSGYRNYLWYMLNDAGYQVDFVGSQRAGEAIRPPFDPDNEGHPGWTTYDIAAHTYEYMVNAQPDIVLLHIGTNDRKTTNPAGVGLILDQIDQYEFASGHHVKVFVALIIDRREHDGRIEIFNERLHALLLQREQAGDDIVIVDMYHNSGLTSQDYADNTHPNIHGYYKMARVWYHAIMNHPYSLPYDDIHLFIRTLVQPQYILDQYIDESTKSVQLTTLIPDSGLQF